MILLHSGYATTPVSHYNLRSKNHPTYRIPSFAQDHYFLLELSNILKPTQQYSFDFTFSSLDEIASLELWNEEIDGPRPSQEKIDCTPQNWYTQYWSNCASSNLSADLDGYEFREICDYEFYDDETIYTGHFLDLY